MGYNTYLCARFCFKFFCFIFGIYDCGFWKAPAFNATTLTLPAPQIDNTGRIIENTRRNYSRNRAEVETEISETIKPLAGGNNGNGNGHNGGNGGNGNNNHKPVASPSKNRIKWPEGINPISAIADTAVAKVISTTPVITEVDSKPKRKRTRSRHKKTTFDPATSDNQQPKDETIQILKQIEFEF